MTKRQKLRVGIFGGTFNPPHVGHLIVAQHVCARLKLDKLFFVPSFISPHKQRGEEALAKQRVSMVRMAIKDHPLFSLSTEEVERRGNSYTVDTLVDFRQRFPGATLFLVIGADNYPLFHTWKDPEKILALARLVVMNRPKERNRTVKHFIARKTRFVSVPDIEISSSDIRQRVQRNESIAFLVPSAVARYIKHHRLYR